MFFNEEKRAELKESNPELKFGEVSAKVGEMWKTDGLDKSKYEDLAAKDKQRYEQEMVLYNEMKKEALAMSSSSDDDSDSEDSVDSDDSDSD